MSARPQSSRLGLPWCAGSLVPFVAVSTTLWLWVALGHDGRKIGQLLLLALPGLLWLFWPLRSARMRTLRSIAL